MEREALARGAPLPPCIDTQFTSTQTTEAHFTQVASIRGEPEAVEVGEVFVKHGSTNDVSHLSVSAS